MFGYIWKSIISPEIDYEAVGAVVEDVISYQFSVRLSPAAVFNGYPYPDFLFTSNILLYFAVRAHKYRLAFRQNFPIIF